MLKPVYGLHHGCVVSPHLQSALSPLTGELLKSEIREFVAWRAGQTTTLRPWSCDSCLRDHMRFRSTAVHALDDEPVFGTVSNSRAMKCTVISQCWRESRYSLWSVNVCLSKLCVSSQELKSHHHLHDSFVSPPPLAVQCCQTNRPWVCWRMVKVLRPCSGYKCSSLWAACTPTSSSTAMSKSATTPPVCANQWVSSCNTPQGISEKCISLLYVQLESLV